MNENNREKRPLPKDFSAFAEVLMEQNRNQNIRLGKLADEMTELTNNVNAFIEKMGRAEERHIADTERMERIEKNQLEHGQEMKGYIHNNDERVTTIEKQILVLDIDSTNKAKKWMSIEKVVISVLSVVIAAGIVGYLTQ